MKKFIILATGEKPDETRLVLVEAENEDAAIISFLEDGQDFTLDDDFEREMANNLLEEFPVGIAKYEDFVKVGDNPTFEWYYEIPK